MYVPRGNDGGREGKREGGVKEEEKEGMMKEWRQGG